MQNKIPLSLTHLEKYMKQAEHLKPDEKLDRARLLELLRAKIQTIDWNSAKSDLEPFIGDLNQLKIWSPQYFLNAIEYLKVE